MPEPAERELTFAQAIREALAEEMRRDSRVCILGEDVAEAGTPFKVLAGLVEEFGTGRVIDTPISEAGFTGVGVGAAMTGMRPVTTTPRLRKLVTLAGLFVMSTMLAMPRWASMSRAAS